MSAHYSPILWNRQKKIYDRVMLGLILAFLLVFISAQMLFFPNISIETLIIRATGLLAFFMLHLILSIGPLTRLNKRFLPLLYNRRHLGVTMLLIALIHGIFNIIQFHTLGDTDPISSLFIANLQYGSLVNFPFQTLGFFALIILFIMAATSHDFWLKNLSSKLWKSLHMMVYLAYALLVMHVMLGVIQLEQSPILISAVGLGIVTIVGLHTTAAITEKRREHHPVQDDVSGFVRVCRVEEIPDNRARMVIAGGENIAIFKYDGKILAVNNVCRHQNGPLGEGKIVDGCITCPWHGYQYLPHNGQAPAPFTEKLETYDAKVVDGVVYVDP